MKSSIFLALACAIVAYHEAQALRCYGCSSIAQRSCKKFWAAPEEERNLEFVTTCGPRATGCMRSLKNPGTSNELEILRCFEPNIDLPNPEDGSCNKISNEEEICFCKGQLCTEFGNSSGSGIRSAEGTSFFGIMIMSLMVAIISKISI